MTCSRTFASKPLALAAVTMILSLPALADDTVLIGLAEPLTSPFPPASAKISRKTARGWRSPTPTPKADAERQTGHLQIAVRGRSGRSAHRRGRRAAFGRRSVASVVGHWNTGASIPAARIYHDAGIGQVAPVAASRNATNKATASFRVMGP